VGERPNRFSDERKVGRGFIALHCDGVGWRWRFCCGGGMELKRDGWDGLIFPRMVRAFRYTRRLETRKRERERERERENENENIHFSKSVHDLGL
jgi:hypothetical protein